MNKYIKIGLLSLLPSFLAAQVNMINAGAKIKVSPNIHVKITSGGVENQSAGEIKNEGNIYLVKDWTQLGTATYTGNGWMWFEGTTNQNLSSVSPLIVPKLRVDNSQRLIIQNDVTVSTQLDLTNNGNIELGNNNLMISPGGTVTNYNASNYVITNGTGVLQQEVGASNIEFPVGNTTYNPATLYNSGTTDIFQVRVFDQVFDQGTTGPLVTTNVVDRTWMIDETVPGGSNITLTLQWFNSNEAASFDRLNCGITHHQSGTLWDNPPTYTAATNIGVNTWTQTRTGFTSFSPFVVRDPNVDLPVELLDFTAQRLNIDEVRLDWITASETNNQGFDVERMLENEVSFTKVAWVDGAGTTTDMQDYNLLDNNSFSGVSYYRLKQIDIDGTASYSPVRAVRGIESIGNITVYPNPTDDMINIRFSEVESEYVNIKIYAADGKLVLNRKVALETYKIVHLPETEQFATGAYLIQLILDNGTIQTQRFIKNRA